MLVVEGRAVQVLGDAAVDERAGQAPIEGKHDGVDVVERTIQTSAAAWRAAGLEELREAGCGASGRSVVTHGVSGAYRGPGCAGTAAPGR